MILNKAVRKKTTCTETSAPERQNTLQKALSFLSYRDHSEAELARKLSRCGFFADTVTWALERCREYGYLDDYRFARERARSLMTMGRAVGPKLMEDLRKRGIEEGLARRAIHEASGDLHETDILKGVFEKRFSGFNFQKARDNEKRRVVNYLMRRGFSFPTVLEFLREKGQEQNHDDGQ